MTVFSNVWVPYLSYLLQGLGKLAGVFSSVLHRSSGNSIGSRESYCFLRIF